MSIRRLRELRKLAGDDTVSSRPRISIQIFLFFFTPQAHAYSIEGLEDINKPQPLHSLKVRMEEMDKQIIRIDGSKSQPQKYVQGVDGT